TRLQGDWSSDVCSSDLAPSAAADEIRLKDGSKILGTIVGYEDNSFKVQASYGFALVRKDKVAAIIPIEPKPEAKKGVAAGAKKRSEERRVGKERRTWGG